MDVVEKAEGNHELLIADCGLWIDAIGDCGLRIYESWGLRINGSWGLRIYGSWGLWIDRAIEVTCGDGAEEVSLSHPTRRAPGSRQ